MSDPVNLPQDERDRLFDPPLVDHLYYDDRRRAYVVTFVPTDEVSDSPTEVAVLHENRADFKRVNALFMELNRLLAPGDFLERVVHSGAGNYLIHRRSGAQRPVADDPLSPTASKAADRLKQIAKTAEMAFRITHAA